MYLVVSVAGCDSTMAITALCVAMACGGASYSGFSASLPELSPRYAGSSKTPNHVGVSVVNIEYSLGRGQTNMAAKMFKKL
jgi:hypothetical protein